VVRTVGSKEEGFEELLEAIIEEGARGPHHEHRIGYGDTIETQITRIEKLASRDKKFSLGYPLRWLAVKLLEGDDEVKKKLKDSPVEDKIEAILKECPVEEYEAIMADKRYEALDAIMPQVVTRGEVDMSTSDMIDRVFTNKYLGIPIFLALMWGAFELTFTFATPFMNLIDWVFAGLAEWAVNNIEPAWLGSLIGDGIFGGVGFVLIFIPNIFILFLLLSFLEDSGYLARAAFVMDKLMYNVGLHGKAFIPLLMGFGCNIPAIMATRTIEDEKDRIITVLINPFISCGARLPVYILLAGAFFGKQASTLIFFVYAFGILLAILSAKLFRLTILPGKPAPFIMELPPYRLPTLKTSGLHMWERGSIYLKKAGVIILGLAIVLWGAASFGPDGYLEESTKDIDAGELLAGEGAFEGNGTFTTLEEGEGIFTGIILEDVSLEAGDYQANQSVTDLALASEESIRADGLFEGSCEFVSEADGGLYTGGDFVAEESFAADIGSAFEPVTSPLGFDWRMNTALVFGFVAKEMVVGSLGVLYGVGEDEGRLSDRLEADEAFTPLTAFCLMLFTLIYMPCVATLAVIYRELKSAKWTAFALGYGLALAWLIVLATYQLGSLMGY